METRVASRDYPAGPARLTESNSNKPTRSCLKELPALENRESPVIGAPPGLTFPTPPCASSVNAFACESAAPASVEAWLVGMRNRNRPFGEVARFIS